MGRSKDRSTKVGAVAIDDNYCLKGSGYNGFREGPTMIWTPDTKGPSSTVGQCMRR